jgi:hypothetical protein
MSTWCFDLDDTITAQPQLMGELMRALKAAGHGVVVISGDEEGPPDPATLEAKQQLLADCGVSDCYDTLHVVGLPVPQTKAAVMADIAASVLIDNKKANCRAVSGAGFAALRLYKENP